MLVKVTNPNAFTGGQAVQRTPVVTQNDLNQAITTVQTKATNAAIQDIQNKEQANEHIVGQPQCSSTASSDHKAGDQVANFHVTVETTCSATVST
jgi:hypothetical protein